MNEGFGKDFCEERQLSEEVRAIIETPVTVTPQHQMSKHEILP